MEQIDATGKQITLIHFVFLRETAASSDGGEESGESIACMPNMTEFHRTPYHPNYQRSNDPRAVNCPACKRTDVYQQAFNSVRR